MNVFDVFKMVLGLIASFFILFFLISYAGIYSQMQENIQRMMILDNFLTAAEDVYLTGNSVVFSDFSKKSIGLDFDGKSDPAKLVSQAGDVLVRIPLVFMPGDKVVIDMKSMDFGWWKFRFAEALPEMTFIFNPTVNEERVRSIMKGMTGLLPDTTGRAPKIRFGLCNGGTIIKPCSNDFCESLSFLGRIDMYRENMQPCTAVMGKGQRLVSFDFSCPNDMLKKGLCIVPPGIGESHGYAFFNETLGHYIYKNPLDLVALAVGGKEVGLYGDAADNLYVHMNAMFRRELSLVADISSQRARLVSASLPDSEEKSECGLAYSEFWTAMDGIIAVTADDYYTDYAKSGELAGYLNDADDAYQRLVAMGCEYQVV